VPWGPKNEKMQYFLQKILAQTALQESAGHVRKVDFYFYFSSVNKHTNKINMKLSEYSSAGAHKHTHVNTLYTTCLRMCTRAHAA
jgi:hypothetical protein